MSLAVLGAAVFDGAGLLGSAGVDRPEVRPTDPPRWRDLFGVPFPSYRRLPAFSKGLCLTAEAAGVRAEDGEHTATVLGSSWGCLETDLRFQASLAQGAELKPALFPYTLPSTCLGELAILYGLRGPCLCMSTGVGDAVSPFEEAALLVDAGEAARALVCVGDWLGAASSLAAGVPVQAAFLVALIGPGPGLCPLGDALASGAPATRLRAVLEERR